MFLATKTPDFQTESLPEGLCALPTKKERTTKGKKLFLCFLSTSVCAALHKKYIAGAHRSCEKNDLDEILGDAKHRPEVRTSFIGQINTKNFRTRSGFFSEVNLFTVP